MLKIKTLTSQEFKSHYNSLCQNIYADGHYSTFYNLPKAVQHFGCYKTGEFVSLASVYRSNNPELFFIGNFQCIDDLSVSHYLLDAIIEFVQSKGGQRIVGPMHGNTWFPYRFSDHQDSSFFLEYIHADYYPEFWLEYGFKEDEVYYSNLSPIDFNYNPSTDYIESKQLKIKSLDCIQEDLPMLYQFCSEHFSKNNYFHEISLKEFTSIFASTIKIYQTDLSYFVYDEDSLVGLFLATEDIHHPQRVIVKTIARDPHVKYKGLARAMSQQFYQKLLSKDYKEQVHAYFHESNKSKGVSVSFGGKEFKRHFLLSLSLNE